MIQTNAPARLQIITYLKISKMRFTYKLGVCRLCQVDHGRLLFAKEVARLDWFIELIDSGQLSWPICVVYSFELYNLRCAFREATISTGNEFA